MWLITLLLILLIQSSFCAIETCYDVWNSFSNAEKAEVIDEIAITDRYTLSSGDEIRCCFVDLGDDMIFIGAMSEYASLSAMQTTLQNCAMYEDCPYNEDDLATGETDKLYRWSLSRMISYRTAAISASSDAQPYLMMSCNMDPTQDYMILPFDLDFVSTSFYNGCYQINLANIRGYECTDSVASFWQDSIMHFHLDSSQCACGGCCSWNTGAKESEDNFGVYDNTNHLFSCAATSTSTTEYWIGSIVQKECVLEVLSIDHNEGEDGTYFNFAKETVDNILSSTDWSNSAFTMYVNGDYSEEVSVKLWNYANDGASSGSAHGRKNPYESAVGGDWEIGDKLEFVDNPCSDSVVLYQSGGDGSLLMKGYNLFKNELSGSRILDPEYQVSNTEYYSTEGSSCSYSSLEFTSSYSSYKDYASADSQSISTFFNALKYSAGGSASITRTETRSNSLSSESVIYTMDLQCSVAEASVVGFNEIVWNDEFINAFNILPESYNNSTGLNDYIDFWNDYGTHVLVTAEFGGNIQGTVIADKCAIADTFSDSTEYEACLNAAYSGITGEACTDHGDSSAVESLVSKSVKNTRIVVKGGNTAQFTNIFNSFQDKTNDFQDWIDELVDMPYIVGGNVDEIHDVIRKTVSLGNHRLNEHLSTAIDDATYLARADALEAAYDDYALQLSDGDTTFNDDECLIDCVDGNVMSSKCICSNCASDCCAANAAITAAVYYVFICVAFFVVFHT